MGAKVFIVQSESRADYKVCFVDSEGRQRGEKLLAGGQLVNSESQADAKVFLVDSESRADILITRKNFPKSR